MLARPRPMQPRKHEDTKNKTIAGISRLSRAAQQKIRFWTRARPLRQRRLAGSAARSHGAEIMDQRESKSTVNATSSIRWDRSVTARSPDAGSRADLRPANWRKCLNKSARVHAAATIRRDRLAHFDRATTRQRTRERTMPRTLARSRGWTREELYVRGRTR